MQPTKMKFSTLLLFIGVLTLIPGSLSAQFTVKDLLSYPETDNLVTAPEKGATAWVFNEAGKRNIFYSEDAGKSVRQLTRYTADNGQVISALSFSPDGAYLIYLYGGEPGGNWSTSTPVNPSSDPEGTKFELLSLEIASGKIVQLAENPDNAHPSFAPGSHTVTFIKKGKVFVVPADGSEQPRQLFEARGNMHSPVWSPNGEKLAFVSSRGSHSFVGVFFKNEQQIKWIDPSFTSDLSPKWSPSSNDSLVFVRRVMFYDEEHTVLKRKPNPWEIRIADIRKEGSKSLWKSPHTLNGSAPTTHGGFNLHWAASGHIVFLATLDNWPHLYSVPVTGGEPLLLTSGNFMVEHAQLSPDGQHLIFSANTGPDSQDIDRRHIGWVPVDKPDMKILTPGDGLEVTPAFVDTDNRIAFLSATPFRPTLPAFSSIATPDDSKLVGEDKLSELFSSRHLVQPQQVIFKSTDGQEIHGILFEGKGNVAKKPAILSIHGGPMRQMTLGWNYSSYYAAQYAVNQWLADRGFTVLWINYRMGIGYGNEFHHPPMAGGKGAAEYKDILASGQWLAARPDIDTRRIGVYGGSYGGYLTALALGKNSDIFAAGVDIHGVHSRLPRQPFSSRIDKADDAAEADSLAWESSPVAHTKNWTSPVLLIHGDDDRNVNFDESIDLLKKLDQQKVEVETLVIPDDTHHFLKHANLIKVYENTTEFLNRKLGNQL